MGREAKPSRPFRQPRYDLGPDLYGRPRTLAPIGPADAGLLGENLAAIDPWAAYRATPAMLAAFFAASEEDCCRRAIHVGGALAGVVVVRQPWLHGPYLQFLGIVPGQQSSGVGSAVLAWMEREAGPTTRNLWLCVTASNTRAQAFYARHGFVRTASLDALVADGMDEILMRKRLCPRPGPQG